MIIRILTLLLAIGLCVQVQAQFSVLFVDDTDDNFENAERFHQSVIDAGYTAVYYEAELEGTSPTAEYMDEFDLVIWHTAGDGTGLYFWNTDDTDNEQIMAYLNNGGKLWVVGLDFLFDRYGSAPVTFSSGDFAYDYLGLESYDVQSQSDDGGLGVPSLTPDESSPVADLNTLSWEFETLWWVDGVTLREGVAPVYRMSGEDYPLADEICGSYRIGQGYIVLSYFFDMSVTETEDMRLENVEAAMSFLENINLSNDDLQRYLFDPKVYPNPNNGAFTLELNLPETTSISARLIDSQGREITNILSERQFLSGKNTIQVKGGVKLKGGVYFVQLISDHHTEAFPVIIE